MPQLRTRSIKVEKIFKTEPVLGKKVPSVKKAKQVIQTFTANDEDIESIIEYPLTQSQRNEFVNKQTGKRVTPFQYRVYDLVRQIPVGHVTSYKIISDKLKASPRAVGQALRVNPFCPLPVACHRIIASDYSIGGFSGGSGDHQLTANKKAKLMREGCTFSDNYIYKANADGTKDFYAFP